MRAKLTIVALAAAGVAAFGVGTVFSGEGQEAPPATPPIPPSPPAELKALEAFIGQWRSTYEFLPAFMGQPGTGTGSGVCEWVLDGWFVMSKFRGTSTMGGFESMGMMTYDPFEKVYRSFHFSSHGDAETATMTHDPQNNTWTMAYESRDAVTSKPAKNRVVMRFDTPDKLDWEWAGQREGETEFTVWMKGSDARVGEPQKR